CRPLWCRPLWCRPLRCHLVGPDLRIAWRPFFATASSSKHGKGDSLYGLRIAVQVACEHVPPIASRLDATTAPAVHDGVDLIRDIIMTVGPQPHSCVVVRGHW